MKRLFLVFFMVAACSFKLHAQDLNTVNVKELLMSREWTSPDTLWTISFSDTMSCHRCVVPNQTVFVINRAFYLSDTADTVFVSSKMGANHGIFVVWREYGNRSSWIELMDIDSDHMVYRSMVNNILELTARPKQGGNPSE